MDDIETQLDVDVFATKPKAKNRDMLGTTDIAWMAKIKRSGRMGMNLDQAQQVVRLLQKAYNGGMNRINKESFAAIGKHVKLGAGTIQFFYYELRRAIVTYSTLEEYWAADRPFRKGKKDA